MSNKNNQSPKQLKVETSVEEKEVKEIIIEEPIADVVEDNAPVQDVPPVEETLTQPKMELVRPVENPNDISIVAKTWINQVKDYAFKMRPGVPVEPQAAALEQYGLFKTIERCLSTESAEEFNAGLTGILEVIHENYRGAFSLSHRLRYLDAIPKNRMESDEITKFVTLLETLVMLSDPAKRQDFKSEWNTDNLETLLEPAYYLRLLTYIDRVTGVRS